MLLLRLGHELQACSLSDEELTALYDEQVTHTGVGIDYYLEEINRRAQEREMVAMRDMAKESHRLARPTYYLTWASTAFALLALVVAVTALFSGK